LLLFEKEEYDQQLAKAISQGSTVGHALTFRTWKKVLATRRKESSMVLVTWPLTTGRVVLHQPSDLPSIMVKDPPSSLS